MNDQKQQQSIVKIGAYRRLHRIVDVFSRFGFMIYERTVRNHHGGPFFGYAAIFSVLKSLAFRDGLCTDQLHAANRAALCCFKQYRCWTLKMSNITYIKKLTIANNNLGFPATISDWKIVLPTSLRWSATAFHSGNFREKPWPLKPLRCPLFELSLLPKDSKICDSLILTSQRGRGRLSIPDPNSSWG